MSIFCLAVRRLQPHLLIWSNNDLSLTILTFPSCILPSAINPICWDSLRNWSVVHALKVVEDPDIQSECLEKCGFIVVWNCALEFQDGGDLHDHPRAESLCDYDTLLGDLRHEGGLLFTFSHVFLYYGILGHKCEMYWDEVWKLVTKYWTAKSLGTKEYWEYWGGW